MADNNFEAITSQEQLDTIIGERLSRAEKKHAEATAGLQKELETSKASITELEKKIKGYETKYAGVDEKIAEMQKTIKTHETDSVKTRIANEFNIPYGMRDRLRGDTEDEIRADARTLSELLPKADYSKSSEVKTSKEDNNRAAMKGMLKELE